MKGRLNPSRGLLRTVTVAAAMMLTLAETPRAATATPDTITRPGEFAGVAAPMSSVSFGTYRIQNRYSAKCLDHFTDGTGPFGNSVGMFTCNDSPSEKWQLIPSGNSYYPYLFRNVDSGKCLTAPGTNIGDHYYMFDCTSSDYNQRFETQAALSGGTFVLYINDAAGDDDILLDEYYTTCCFNGSPVGNFTFTNHPLQRWNFLPA